VEGPQPTHRDKKHGKEVGVLLVSGIDKRAEHGEPAGKGGHAQECTSSRTSRGRATRGREDSGERK